MPGFCCWRWRGETRWVWLAARIAGVCDCAICWPDTKNPAAIAIRDRLDGRTETVRGGTGLLVDGPAIVCANTHVSRLRRPARRLPWLAARGGQGSGDRAVEGSFSELCLAGWRCGLGSAPPVASSRPAGHSDRRL